MTRWGFHFGKLLLLVLAVTSSALLFFSYRKVAALTERDADLRAALTAERQEIARQVMLRYYSDSKRMERAVAWRQLPSDTIEGLPELPPALIEEVLAIAARPQGNDHSEGDDNAAAIRDTTVSSAQFKDLLFDDGNFFSGIPKRYAGLIELLREPSGPLSTAVQDRLKKVLGDFWKGVDLSTTNYRFFLDRIPASLATYFDRQSIFLGVLPASAERPYIRLMNEERAWAFEISTSDLAEINRQAAALGSALRFKPAATWTQWEGVFFNLAPEAIPVAGRLAQTRRDYLLTGISLWLLLLVMSALLHKYEKVNRAQKQLLTATSHELRTPLAVMRQFSEMLLDKRPNFSDRVQTYHEYIHRECLRMQFLVENLLSAARIERLSLQAHPSRFNLQTWLEGLCEDYRQLHPGLSLTLHAAAIQVVWDESLMRQLVINLLENARIHAGTAIEVETGSEGGSVQIRVRDFGEHADFKRLRRIRAFRPGGKAGIGLGLYLCHRIAAAHGGKLRFTHASPGVSVILKQPREIVDSVQQKQPIRAPNNPSPRKENS